MKQDPGPDPAARDAAEPTLGRRLYLAHRAQHDLLDARMRERGASLWNWVLLRTAVELDGASQREIADRIGIEPPTLVPQLDQLADEGLLRRRRDDRDRRVMRVYVTPTGHRRLEELHDVAMQTDAELRALLSPREVEVLAKALPRIHEHFTALKQKEAPMVAMPDAARDEVIGTEALTKVYPGGVLAVDGLDLSVRRGEIFGLLGPNGAGKTTTGGMLTTRVIPTSGRAFVGGVDVVAHPTAAKQVIGVVPQTNTLDRSLTVWENLYFHGRFFGMNSRSAKSDATRLLEQFRLTDRGSVGVDALSGGMAQRLMVARAIMHRPAILFLDEPTAGLDPQSRIALWDILGELHRAGQTILLTTHYMEEADELCDRLAIIDHGKLLALDTPEQLKRSVGIDAMITVSAAGDLERLASVLREGLTDATRVEHVDDVVRVWVRHLHGVLPAIVETAEKQGFTVTDLSSTEPTLETVFINLTGKDLRE